jgi:hypothetical protein
MKNVKQNMNIIEPAYKDVLSSNLIRITKAFRVKTGYEDVYIFNPSLLPSKR